MAFRVCRLGCETHPVVLAVKSLTRFCDVTSGLTAGGTCLSHWQPESTNAAAVATTNEDMSVLCKGNKKRYYVKVIKHIPQSGENKLNRDGYSSTIKIHKNVSQTV